MIKRLEQGGGEPFELRNGGDEPSIPLAVVEYALSLKQPEVLDSIELPDDAPDMTPEDARLFKARTVGNTAVGFALGTYVVSSAPYSKKDKFLGNLAPDDQHEVLQRLMDQGPDPHIHMSPKLVRHLVAHAQSTRPIEGRWLRDRVAYANFLPGSFPPGSWPAPRIAHHDVMLTQAFGRNSITEAELPIVHEAREAGRSDEEMFDWLAQQDFDPGISNRDLAGVIANDLRDETTHREHVLQWEVAYALYISEPALYARFRKYLHVLFPPNGKYPTYRVKADSIKQMDAHGLMHALELAHQDMAVRSVGILRQQGVWTDLAPAHIRFDPDSTQPWTRNPLFWTGREFLARGEHVLNGRVRF